MIDESKVTQILIEKFEISDEFHKKSSVTWMELLKNTMKSFFLAMLIREFMINSKKTNYTRISTKVLTHTDGFIQKNRCPCVSCNVTL